MDHRDELQKLHHQLELANRAIPMIGDPATVQRLERLAEEIKAKFDDLQGAVKREAIGRRAFELWHKAGRPKGRDLEFWLRAEGEQREDHMTHVYEDDIRARAYKLWEEAGRPEGRMDEFWQKAERQLEEEQVKRELKTPDTL
jgi:Protein of unknown function (DUF2934)